MEIQFDENKSDFILTLNFNGVMELGYAIFLYDNNGITSLWNPPKEGTNLDNERKEGTIVILSQNNLPPVGFYDGKSLDLSFAFSGIDENLKNYEISATFLQQGKVLGEPFVLKGELTGKDQDSYLYITMKSIKS